MAESPEHQFLSEIFLSILSHLAGSKLYSFKECPRKKFDFSCILSEGWEYALDGQTLWRHSEGVDKDLRTLLFSSNAQISAYVARDTTKNRSLLYEATQDFESSVGRSFLQRLRVFWVPADFDADSEVARRTVAQNLEREVVEDVLFNVVLGRLTSSGLRSFAYSVGVPDTGLRVLHSIATEGFPNYARLTKRLGYRADSLKVHVLRLQMAGLLLQPRSGMQYYHVGSAGRTVLRLCAQLHALLQPGASIAPETRMALNMLEVFSTQEEVDEVRKVGDSALIAKTLPQPTTTFMRLLIKSALGSQGIDWQKSKYMVDKNELDRQYWM